MFYINFYSDKWVGTVLLTLTGQEVPGGKSPGEREGEAGAGVETETGGDDTRSTGDILQKAVIQVTLINIEQPFFILKHVNNFQEYFFFQ